MSRYYEDYLLIPQENNDIFTNAKKHELNTVEKIGLESIMCDFISDYELNTYGEIYSNDFSNYIRWNSDSVDILDGIHDTYVFDEIYAISELWMLENGVVVMSVIDLSTASDYNENDFDAYNFINSHDIYFDCNARFIRLGGF